MTIAECLCSEIHQFFTSAGHLFLEFSRSPWNLPQLYLPPKGWLDPPASHCANAEAYKTFWLFIYELFGWCEISKRNNGDAHYFQRKRLVNTRLACKRQVALTANVTSCSYYQIIAEGIGSLCCAIYAWFQPIPHIHCLIRIQLKLTFLLTTCQIGIRHR